jgi:hypothetical protein
MTRAAILPGMISLPGHSSQQTQQRMSTAVVGVVARMRRNFETAMIGRSSGIHW